MQQTPPPTRSSVHLVFGALRPSPIARSECGSPFDTRPRRADIKNARDLVIRLKTDRHSSSLTDEISLLSDRLEARPSRVGFRCACLRACAGKRISSHAPGSCLHARLLIDRRSPRIRPVFAHACRAGASRGLHALGSDVRRTGVRPAEDAHAAGGSHSGCCGWVGRI